MTDHREIERIAAEWLLRRQEDDWSELREAQLQEWLTASHAHAAAFWRLEYADQALDRISWDKIEPTQIEVPGPYFLSRSAGSKRLLALAATLIIAVLGYWMLPLLQNGEGDARFATYTNELGEVSQIIMTDGTQIALDSQSTILVGEGNNSRLVKLVRGRALLDVATDPDHPFVVQAGLADVRVLGTKFVLDRQKSALEVAVIEGAVRVSRNKAAPEQAVTLAPGDVATMNQAAIKLTNVDIAELERSVSWREGKVVLDDTPLAEAVAQFNRYNERKIMIALTSGSHHRVSGVFKLSNIDGFTRLIREAYGVDIKIIDPEAK